MSSIDELYPNPCAFCKISSAYPAGAKPIPSNPDPDKVSPQCHLILSTPHVLAFLDIMPMAPGHLLITTRDHYRTLADLFPPATSKSTTTATVSGKATQRDWVTRRQHLRQRDTARALGRWLPVVSRALCKVTGIEDWNVVQNNGERAAQVVPHIHFHLIPRYQEGRGRDSAAKSGSVSEGAMLKSWKMFGRGTREDLDDDEGADMAGRLRKAIEEEIALDEGDDDVGAEVKSKL